MTRAGVQMDLGSASSHAQAARLTAEPSNMVNGVPRRSPLNGPVPRSAPQSTHLQPVQSSRKKSAGSVKAARANDPAPLELTAPPPAPRETDPGNILNSYIYDYLMKRKWHPAAQAFAQEARLPPDTIVPIDAPDGFLFEWWSVFWDIFDANHSKTGSEEATIYLEHEKKLRRGHMAMNQRMASAPSQLDATHSALVAAQRDQLRSAPESSRAFDPQAVNTAQLYQQQLQQQQQLYLQQQQQLQANRRSASFTTPSFVSTPGTPAALTEPRPPLMVPTGQTPVYQLLPNGEKVLHYTSKEGMPLLAPNPVLLQDGKPVHAAHQEAGELYASHDVMPQPVNTMTPSLSMLTNNGAYLQQQQPFHLHQTAQMAGQPSFAVPPNNSQMMPMVSNGKRPSFTAQPKVSTPRTSFSPLQACKPTFPINSSLSQASPSTAPPTAVDQILMSSPPDAIESVLRTLRLDARIPMNLINQQALSSPSALSNGGQMDGQAWVHYLTSEEKQTVLRAVTRLRFHPPPAPPQPQMVAPQHYMLAKGQNHLGLSLSNGGTLATPSPGLSSTLTMQKLPESLSSTEPASKRLRRGNSQANGSVPVEEDQRPGVSYMSLTESQLNAYLAAGQLNHLQVQAIRQKQQEMAAQAAVELPLPSANGSAASSSHHSSPATLSRRLSSHTEEPPATSLPPKAASPPFLREASPKKRSSVEPFDDFADLFGDDLGSTAGDECKEEHVAPATEAVGEQTSNGSAGSRQVSATPSNGSPNGTVQLLHAKMESHSSKVTCCAFNRDGSLLATGSNDRRVFVHTSHDGRRIATLDGHAQQITSLAWTMVQEEDGTVQSVLATASYDSNVKIWRPRDGPTWYCDQTFSQHTHAVTAVHFQQSVLPSSQTLLVASLDAEGDIRIWCAATLTVKVALSIAGREFTGFTPCPLKFSPISPYQTVAMAMGTQLVILSLDDSILQDSHSAVAKRASLPAPHEKSINTLDFSPDGQWLLLASDEKITVWHTATWQLVYTQTVRMDKISSSTFIGNDTLAWGEYQAMYLLDFQAFVAHAGRVPSHYHHGQGRIDSSLEPNAPTPFENGQKMLTIPLAHPAGSLTGLSWVRPQHNANSSSSLICSVSTDKYENVRVWQVNPLIASS